MPQNEAPPEKAGRGDTVLLAGNSSEISRKARITQAQTFDREQIESHVRLLHSLAAGCKGLILLTPIWEGESPRPQRFKIGDVDGMVRAVMTFEKVPGANMFAQYGSMRCELPPGKKGGESDVEAVFASVADIDSDKCVQCTIPVDPSYVIESSPGNFQRVYIFPRPLPVSKAKPVLCALHAAIGGDSAQRDCSHVWRIPGTANWPTKSKLARGRSPEPVMARIASPFEGLLVDPAELLALAPPVKKLLGAEKFSRSGNAVDEKRLRAALAVIPAHDRGVWLRIGMALHEAGLRDVWDDWSQTSDKFDPVDQDKTWNAFKAGGGITIATVFYHAKMRGWK